MLISKDKKITFEKKTLNKDYFTESSLSMLSTILTEARGIFPKQVELTDLLSSGIVTMIRNNIMKQKYDIREYSPFKSVIVSIELPKNDYIWSGYMISGELTELSDEYMLITIKIPRCDILALDDATLHKKITPCIAHELNHAYVGLMKYFNSSTYITMPNYYENVLALYKAEDNSIPEEVRDLAYLLYSTNPYEIQARVSQVYQEIDELLVGKEVTLDTIKNALNHTDTYKTFFDNAHYCSNSLKTYLSNNMANVLYWFEQFGVNDANEKFIWQVFEDAVESSKNAIRAMGKVAMEYYYKNI